MKKLLFILITLLYTASFVKATDIKGIRVESDGYPILVYLDGAQMCSPVYSCFIANLRAGSYRVEVYNARSNQRVYLENIYYNGFRIEEINIENQPGHNRRPGHDRDEYSKRNRVMDEKEFDKFYNSIVSATFDSEKNSLIDLGLAGNDFTTGQVARLVGLYTFDKDKLPLLKKFYRNTVDKANYYSLLEKLDFLSSKNELKEFILNFNK